MASEYKPGPAASVKTSSDILTSFTDSARYPDKSFTNETQASRIPARYPDKLPAEFLKLNKADRRRRSCTGWNPSYRYASRHPGLDREKAQGGPHAARLAVRATLRAFRDKAALADVLIVEGPISRTYDNPVNLGQSFWSTLHWALQPWGCLTRPPRQPPDLGGANSSQRCHHGRVFRHTRGNATALPSSAKRSHGHTPSTSCSTHRSDRPPRVGRPHAGTST